jgi:hypothetical protein
VSTLTLAAIGGIAEMRVEAERKRLGIVEPLKVVAPEPEPAPPPAPAPAPREFPAWEIEARAAADQLHHQLRERFPGAFVRTKALKIGISEDIIAAFPDVNPLHVGYYMQRYCGCVPYLMASVQEGALRFDLAGVPVGMVTPAEARGANGRLAAKLKKQAKLRK